MPAKLTIVTDTKKINTLSAKLEKYGPYAMKTGLQETNKFMNTDAFKQDIYAPSHSGESFMWSSEKQRRAFFASDGFGAGIPTQRSYGLVQSGAFTVNEGYLTIEFDFPEPYKYVIHPQYQIVGHKKRQWKTIPAFIKSRAKDIARVFTNTTKKAWKEMDKIVFGGSPGL